LLRVFAAGDHCDVLGAWPNYRRDAFMLFLHGMTIARFAESSDDIQRSIVAA
jgi:hypothetical protein